MKFEFKTKACPKWDMVMLPLGAKRAGLGPIAVLIEYPIILPWAGSQSLSRYPACYDQVGTSVFLNPKLTHDETL